jgi:hypothetical protein
MPVQLLHNQVIELLDPLPDGVVQEFSTSRNFKPGTVSVWLNGMRLIQEYEDGFLEIGNRYIRLKEIPRPGDCLQAQYEAET